MKNLSILFNIFGFLLLFASCSRDYPLHDKDTQFPLSVGNWWQYEEVWIIEDIKHIKDDINHNGTVHWKIIDRDAVGRERYDTYVLECNDYSEWSEPYYSFNWYSESWEGESGLFHIAHWGVGTSCPKLFLPYKIKFMNREFNSPDEVFDYIRGFIYTKEDTTLRVPPRKVLVYPLWFGKEWVAFDDAWLQERRVVDMETISTPAGDFSCYKIEVYGDIWDEDAVWYDWFSNEGLIKRYFWFRSDAVDPSGNFIGTYEFTCIQLLENYYDA